MNIFSLMSIFITIAALIAYINIRTLRLPTTIAIMSGSLLFSLVLIIGGKYGLHDYEHQTLQLVSKIDFRELLMQGMLSFLLFAGALNVDINHLRDCKWEIGVLASVSTVASTFLVGTACFYLLPYMGFKLPYIYCLLFGALISPTDPIAVLTIFKQVGAPEKLDVTVTGESLFNDGVAIVVFLTLYQVAFTDQAASTSAVALLFFRQAIGGIGYGIALGILGHWLIKPIDNYKVEILITIAMATGGYVLANALDISGPLAMVTAGIFLGNKGRNFSMSHKTRENLDNFWELVDEILNAILFLLIGLELLMIAHTGKQVIAGLLAIPFVLLIRFITVGIPISLFKVRKKYPPHYISILVWGGLRGGLAVALALTLPANAYRSLILTMTYCIVVFAIVIQGLSVKPLVRLSKEHC